LQTPWFDGEEDEDEDDVSSGDDNDDDDDDASSEHGDKVEGDRNNRGNKDENRNVDKDAKAYNGQSKVRLFMTGMTGDEDALDYRDQVEEVASICEQANLGELETKTGQDRKHVALLDDRNIRGTILANKGTSPPGDYRPYLGPLNAERLGKELSRKVAQISFWHQSSREANTLRSVSE
jgi:hypothetical protein